MSIKTNRPSIDLLSPYGFYANENHNTNSKEASRFDLLLDKFIFLSYLLRSVLAMACCVAVLLKENLIYLRRSTEELKLLFLIHASIDILDDRISLLTKPGVDRDVKDFYLGLLYPVEEYKIYGYVSSTRVKFILIFEHSTPTSLKDPDIKISFQRLHQAYIDCVSNPFYEPNTQLKSKRFEQVVTNLMVQTDSMISSVSLSPPSLLPSA